MYHHVHARFRLRRLAVAAAALTATALPGALSSRAVRVRLDERRRTATLVQSMTSRRG